MTVLDGARPGTIRLSHALAVMIRPAGIAIPAYGEHEELPLDLHALRLLEALATGGAVDPDEPLLRSLQERGLVVARTSDPDDPAPAPVEPAGQTVQPTDALVLASPALLSVGPHGFGFVDHAGTCSAALSATELVAASAFVVARPLRAAVQVQAELLGDDALLPRDLRALATRLRDAGVLLPYDSSHPDHAKRARSTQTLQEAVRRRAEVNAEFERLEAEHDAAGVPTDAVRIIGAHTSWSAAPSSLGMVLAAAKAHDGGALTTAYDVRPRLAWDADRLAAAASGPPAVLLFSNYIWSSPTNLANSALAKQLNPHHVTIHGGPNTPKYRGDVEDWFAANPHVDIAVHGEGEATFPELLAALRGHIGDGPPDLSPLEAVPGLSFRLGDRVITTEGRDRIADLDTIPSPVLTGLFDGFIPAGGDGSGLILETNRGCPYGCTFCDWGSATLSRVRKFDLDRVFAELEWCAKHHLGVGLADANFGIFERDVAIAEKIAELKATYGYPKVVGNNYAKNTVKHLSRIIEIFTDAGITAEGKMSMQTFDEGTLTTIRRKNIKVEKYHDLSVEFRRNALPMSVDIMMGLPGATVESFRNDLQSCIDRDLRAVVHSTQLLMNSPMNDPEYREANGITARPGEEVRETSTFTRGEWEHMRRLRMGFWMFENFGVLRQVATYTRSVTGRREVDLYDRLVEDVAADPERWPLLTVVLQVLPPIMVPPVSWGRFIDEVRRYLVEVVGLEDDDRLETVLRVQLALLPARDRELPEVVELPHDWAAFHAQVRELREAGRHADWHEAVTPLGDLPPARFPVADPLESCQRNLGRSYVLLAEDSAWDLDSPVSRPRQALVDDAEEVA